MANSYSRLRTPSVENSLYPYSSGPVSRYHRVTKKLIDPRYRYVSAPYIRRATTKGFRSKKTSIVSTTSPPLRGSDFTAARVAWILSCGRYSRAEIHPAAEKPPASFAYGRLQWYPPH